MNKFFNVCLILFLYGCGVDPDDFMVQESDGCMSTDTECKAKLESDATAEGITEESEASTEGKTEEATKEENKEKSTDTITVESEVTVKTKVVIGPNGEQISEENADNCMANRICRGTTKAEIISLLGNPQTLKKREPFETWEWKEFSGEKFICGDFTCEIMFRDGLVVDQDRINTQWLDLQNF